MKRIADLNPGDLFTIGEMVAYDLRREPSIYVEFEKECFYGPLLFIGENVTVDDAIKFLLVIPRKPGIPGWLAVSRYWKVNVL